MMNQLYTLHASMIDHSTDIYRDYAGLPHGDQPFHSRWGDGEEFSDDEINTIGELIHAHSESVELNTGDMVVLDNTRWGHGREPYEGERRILVSMSTPLSRRTMHVPSSLNAANYC